MRCLVMSMCIAALFPSGALAQVDASLAAPRSSPSAEGGIRESARRIAAASVQRDRHEHRLGVPAAAVGALVGLGVGVGAGFATGKLACNNAGCDAQAIVLGGAVGAGVGAGLGALIDIARFAGPLPSRRHAARGLAVTPLISPRVKGLAVGLVF